MQDIIRNDKRHALNRPITGIIQNDRIWEQWYDPSIFSMELPKMTQKDYLFKCIGDEPNRTIINNRGMKKYSVNDFAQLIMKFEKAFSAIGLQKGDVICTIGLTTPELYAIKYSSTSLGLVTCNLNFLNKDIDDGDKNQLFSQIKEIKPKVIFTLDILENMVNSVVNEDEFNDILKITMPLDYSSPIYNPERIFISLKRVKDVFCGKRINNSISLSNFLMLGNYISFDEVDEVYEDAMPCNISFTSGTTGINKGVLLSHDANNALAFQQQIAELGYRKDSKQLTLVPPFLAFWDSAVVHVALCVKAQNIIELSLDNEKIPQYFKKYKGINCGMWAQYTWNSLLSLSKEELEEISKDLYLPIIGGERCEVNQAETFYKKSGIRLLTGYGASEVNTTFSFNHPYCNKLGSSGLPLPFNNVKIVDESFKDVSYNKSGRLLISSPCLMNGYFNRPDLTSKVLYIDEKGTKWYYTGDYAVMDNDGCLTVLDRYSAPITIKTDTNTLTVNLIDINEIIKQNKFVKNSKLMYCNDKIILHLIVDEMLDFPNEEKINSIKETIMSKIPKELWPDYINIEEEFVRTSVGKVDYKILKEKNISIIETEQANEKMIIINNSKIHQITKKIQSK